MQKTVSDIAIFLIVVSVIIIMMITFIIGILFIYRKRQQAFEKSLTQLKLDHEKTILSTQLEIQEQTFQHVSREIHDNINLSLTLAKLNLNTIGDYKGLEWRAKIDNSIELLSKSIVELSNISKALNADLIIQQGLVRAVEGELLRIEQASRFRVEYSLIGNPVYLDSRDELIVFRIIQEALNNILKHAGASLVNIIIKYEDADFSVTIKDNGRGFDLNSSTFEDKAGLKNMISRAKTLGGIMTIESRVGVGTVLKCTIPFKNIKH